MRRWYDFGPNSRQDPTVLTLLLEQVQPLRLIFFSSTKSGTVYEDRTLKCDPTSQPLYVNQVNIETNSFFMVTSCLYRLIRPDRILDRLLVLSRDWRDDVLSRCK